MTENEHRGPRDKGRTKKRRGRPAGAKNVRRELVELTPPTCPNCGRSVTVNLNTVPDLVHAGPGRTAAGKPYDEVQYRNTVCECGQHLRVRTPVRMTSEGDDA